MSVEAAGLAGQPGDVVAFLVASALVAGLARGFSGFGAGLIFIPLASAAVGPLLAAPILLVIDAVGAAPMLPDAWRRADRRAVFVMSAGALVALPLGALALTRLDPIPIRWGISVTILLLVALLASGWRYIGKPHLLVTVLIGGLSGLLSGVAQIGGPPAVAYWLGSASSSARSVRANVVLFAACSTVYSFGAFAVAGLLNVSVAVLSLATGPAYLAGTLLGMRIFGLASQKVFRRICYMLIVTAAVVGLPVFR